jgi:hypothetical protein
MTEERMICRKITATHGDVTEERWYPESTAPSKDWKPRCFKFTTIKKDCKGEWGNGTMGWFLHPECKLCPFRKLED